MLRRELMFVAAIALAGAAFVTVGAQQEVQSRPGFGSGVMDVRVVNHPAVTAAQSGAWEVGLSRPADARIIGMPHVTMASPSFIRTNVSYRVTWSATESETVKITEAGGGGWVEVNGARWINLDQARSVEAVR
jgi:hypothetical protein